MLPGRLQTGLNLIHQRRIGIQDQGLCRRMAVEISWQLTSACQRNELVVVQIAGLRLDTQPILDGLCHVGWELDLDALLALRTYLDFGFFRPSLLGGLPLFRLFWAN